MLSPVRLTTNVTIGDKFAEIHIVAGQTLEYYQNREGDCEIRGEGDYEVCAFMPQ